LFTGKTYRLPTEAEWEYAARGGKKSKGYKYSGSNTADDVAWYFNNSGYKLHEVGTKNANELGLFDMSGNVHEKCQDWIGDYSSVAETDPTGVTTTTSRVIRGGAWISGDICTRITYRDFDHPDERRNENGFRLACSSE
jgi:formylglycine-generating enzyme required for sulfatase activity